MSKMSEELNFVVLHAVNKAIKRDSVTINEHEERVYKLSRQDVRTLEATGVSTFEAGGQFYVLMDDTLIEFKDRKAATWPTPGGVEKGGRVVNYVPTKGEAKKWNEVPVVVRSEIARQAGLEGKLGSKAWADLTDKEQAVIRGLSWGKGERKPEPEPQPKKKATKKAKAGEKPSSVTDLLMWVGTKHYSTIGDFIQEAREVGCCKRIGKVLHVVEPGKTRIFLAHDEGLVGEGFIFGYFTVARIEIIVKNLDELPERFTDDLTPVTLSSARQESVRGCGWRDSIGALYFVSETNVAELKRVAKAIGINYADVKGGFVKLYPPRIYGTFVPGEGKHFRGALQITNGDAIIQASVDQKRLAPSQKAPKSGQDRKWTKADNKALRKAVRTREGSRQRALTEYAISNGRPRAKVIYHYSKLMGVSDA